jgi:hypothetical protein
MLQMAGLIGTTVELQEFKNVSIVILCYLSNLPMFCTANSKPDLKKCQQYLTNSTNQLGKSHLNVI